MRIKKYYFLIICLISMTNYVAYSQCFVTAKALYQGNVFTDTVEVCQGSNLMLFTEDSCKNPNCSGVILQEDFNNMTLGNGWSSTFANPVFNNPCQCPFTNGLPPSSCAGMPGQFGTDGAFAWIGTTVSNERTLATQAFDLTPYQNNSYCKIQFWMMYGITPNAGSCEDPDEAAEGVHLQYSVNNGTTWTDFPGPYINPVGNLSPTPPFVTTTPGSGGYWAPQSALTAQLQSTVYFWNRYQVNLPNNIYTNNTKFRWAQLATSSTGYDAWGLDNISIDCNYNNVIYNWSNGTNTNQNVINLSCYLIIKSFI